METYTAVDFEAARERKSLEDVAQLMRSHAGDVAAQMKGCAIITDLFRCSESASLSTESGSIAAVDAVLDALSTHGLHLRLHVFVCTALRFLCDDTRPVGAANRNHAVARGAIALVLLGIRDDTPEAYIQVQSYAILALSRLVYGPPSHRQRARRDGALGAVLIAKARQPGAELLQQHALTILKVLCSSGEAYNNDELESVSLSIVTSMKDHPGSCCVQYTACSAMGIKAETARELVRLCAK